MRAMMLKKSGVSLGPELVTNSEFAAGTGWVTNNVTATYIDSTTDPGAASGGVTNNCVKLVATSTAPRLRFALPTLDFPGTYRISCRAYAKSTNTRVNGACIALTAGTSPGGGVEVVSEDNWQTITQDFAILQAAGNGILIAPRALAGATSGDIAYFDMVSCRKIL